MTASTKLFLLGTPRIEHHQQVINLARRRAIALLACLAVTQRTQRRDALISLLYPDMDIRVGRAEFRRILSALNTTLPDDVLRVEGEMVVLSDRVWVDVLAFENALTVETVDVSLSAIDLYTGDFMVGFSISGSVAFDNWQFEQQERLRRRYILLLRHVVDHYTEKREWEKAVRYARRWLAADDLDEQAYRTLMKLYTKTDQISAALRLYEECVRVLATELQVVPETETTRLYEMIKSNRSDRPAIAVMPPQPRLIVGRENILRDMIDSLRSRLAFVSCPLMVVQGWPGVGKSTTLAALAHDPQIETLFPDGVLWASLGATPNLSVDMSLWANALGIKVNERNSSLEMTSAQIRNLLYHRRVLLLVDDVWSVSHAMLFQVGGPQCAVVFSTRQNDIANALVVAPDDIYRLPVLTESGSLELLSRLAPAIVQTHPESSLALVRDLEGLPLAIQVAGRLLRIESHAGWGIDELLEDLRNGTKLLASQPPVDVAYPQSSPTITALLRKSTDSLTADMRMRFIYLGIFAPKPATYDLRALAIAWNEHDPRPAVRVFIERGLIEPAQAGRFQMHALLAMHARSLAEN